MNKNRRMMCLANMKKQNKQQQKPLTEINVSKLLGFPEQLSRGHELGNAAEDAGGRGIRREETKTLQQGGEVGISHRSIFLLIHRHQRNGLV